MNAAWKLKDTNTGRGGQIMSWKRQILAVTAVLVLPVWALAEDGQNSTQAINEAESPLAAGENGSYIFPDRQGGFLEGSPYLVRGQSPYWQDGVARFGWWGVAAEGSPSGVGEWTGLNSNAFWDIDTLMSDGTRTLDFAFSGPMDETTDLSLYYFGPHLTAEIDAERFLHRYGYKPLNAWFDRLDDPSNIYTPPPPPRPSNPIFQGQNFNETTDHAIRVQEVDAKFSGNLAENLKWRLDVWGMRKTGERQKMAMDHNCSGHRCHQVTQTQSIEWTTMEIVPGLEAKMGPVTLDYSRTMRGFEQDDEVVTRSYVTHPGEITPGVQHPYGVVAENYTEIDKIKIGADISENNQFYANMFNGNTHNEYRETDRGFWGVDLRLTNTSLEDLRLTGYAKHYEDDGQVPTFHPEADQFLPPVDLAAEVRHPVNRQWTTAGLKGRWTPLEDSYRWRGLAFTGGYEYKELQRQFVTYAITGSPAPNTFTQPDTFRHCFDVGVEKRVSACFDTYLRYRMVNTDDPLYGVRESDRNFDEDSPAGDVSAINTNQPTHQDEFELGGTWAPAENFMLGAQIGMEIWNHNSRFARFDEDSYPVTLTAWYAPTSRWSLSGALGFYSNFIDQDLSFGIAASGADGQVTLPADYTGRADMVTLGTNYLLTKRLSVNGDFQFVRGENGWFVPNPSAAADYSTLPGFSAVVVETLRFGAGLDYELSCNSSCFCKYMYYDYNDEKGNVFSGTYHMILGGLAARY